MPGKKTQIPSYSLENFLLVHRTGQTVSVFGNNDRDKEKTIPGFELYSSEGIVRSVGPLRSEFYRISLTVSGTLDMLIGLEAFRHQPRTISFTVPNQIFQKNNISSDAFGYYLLFKSEFLQDLLPAAQLTKDFPFFGLGGTPVFQLSADELNALVGLFHKMNEEIRQNKPGKEKAVQLYLYLLLLEAQRSYQRQQLTGNTTLVAGNQLVSRFHRLLAIHYLSKRQVADYALLLGVSANHLNKMVKEITGRTASDSIREMLLQEAKSLLRYTDSSISEIAYQLDFSEPAAFNRFFRTAVRETPLSWRNKYSTPNA